jgi:hypothetical protein
MATLKSMKVKSKEVELTPIVTVDMEIIEYFYAATFNDIICDNDLMRLIVSNGYYKEAFCDAHNIDNMVITVDKKDHKMSGPPRNLSSTLDILEGKTRVIPLGIKIING